MHVASVKRHKCKILEEKLVAKRQLEIFRCWAKSEEMSPLGSK
jgi:hypothetical protein